MTWSKGKPWRVVRSLDALDQQIRAAYPRAVPPATPASSWGAIADDAHSATSDHYPHYYAALGSTAVVCARDFPHAPALGLDAHALAERLRQARDPRVAYIISNGRITGPSHDWKWERYTGSDPHDTHIHVSTVHTAAADGTKDWNLGEDDDMPLTDAEILKITTFSYGEKGRLYDNTYFAAANAADANKTAAAALAKVTEIQQTLTELKATPPGSVVIGDEQLERVLRRVIGSVDGVSPS